MASESKTLLIRVDGDAEIGTGHVMRCLALAQAWRRRGGETVFVCALVPEALEQRLSTSGFEVRRHQFAPGSAEDANHVVALIDEYRVSAVACDGYPFGLGFQEIVHSAGIPFLVIADYAIDEPFACDYLLNQNLAASRSDYPALTDSTIALTGPTYSLFAPRVLRSETGARQSGSGTPQQPARARHARGGRPEEYDR